MTNKKFQTIINELFTRCRKLSILLILAYILSKTCLIRDLVVVIFIYYKIINLDSISNKYNKEHNENWPYIPDHPYRILIIGGSG